VRGCRESKVDENAKEGAGRLDGSLPSSFDAELNCAATLEHTVASESSLDAMATRWAPIVHTGSGVRLAFKYPVVGHVDVLPRAVLDLCHRRARTTSGPTTSCSTRRRRDSRSSASPSSTNGRERPWPSTSRAAGRVIDVLARLVSDRGAPRYLRSDNGPEFVSSAILRWTTAEGIETAHIAPGKPWQNGTDESFNGRLREECLSMEWFRTRREAAAIIETWRRHYNEVRPHSSLGYLTPTEFRAKHTTNTDQIGAAAF
jgi:Integrase core domain